MACEHPTFRSFRLSSHNELPRIVLRQCACHHWWITYSQEDEPSYRVSPRFIEHQPVSGIFRVAAAPIRTW